MTKVAIADCEGNGFLDKMDKMHCVAVKLKGTTGLPTLFTNMKEFIEFVEDEKPDKWVFHNGLAYDYWAIDRFVKKDLIKPEQIVDSMVVSKLVNYAGFSTHSLKEIGKFLGVHKDDYQGGFDEYSEEMGTYCVQDVVVNEAILDYYWKYIVDPSWAKSMRVEHEIALICHGMQETGFPFDKREATSLLRDLQGEMSVLEDNFKKAFGSQLKEVKRIQWRTKADGTLYKNVEEALDKYPKTRVEGSELVCFDHVEFNPGSPKQRIDVLWDQGWKPFEKTKGHIAAERKARRR